MYHGGVTDLLSHEVIGHVTVWFVIYDFRCSIGSEL